MTYRKLILVCAILFFLLACDVSVTVFNSTPTPFLPTATPPPTVTPIPLISQQVTLGSLPFNENNPGSTFPQYTLSSMTPQLVGSEDPRVTAFNKRLSDLVSSEVDVWRKNFQELPITQVSYSSSLEVTYTLISQIGDLWSFKFDMWFYANAAAHPGLNSLTLTYDLGQGRELALSDLFLPGSGYLEVISKNCMAELKKQPYSESFSLEGAKPTLENYRNWNVKPDGLMITFDMYQVAPGAAGPITVLVPWNQLSAQVDPQGPLAGLVR